VLLRVLGGVVVNSSCARVIAVMVCVTTMATPMGGQSLFINPAHRLRRPVCRDRMRLVCALGMGKGLRRVVAVVLVAMGLNLQHPADNLAQRVPRRGCRFRTARKHEPMYWREIYSLTYQSLDETNANSAQR
jgi:hypothetical protein